MNLINACLSPFDYKFNMVINHVYFFHKPFYPQCLKINGEWR